MTSFDGVDLERRLADALHAEATAVLPAGDGLRRIRARTERRRRRLRWLRPTLAVTATATVGAAVVLAVTLGGADVHLLRTDDGQPAGPGGPAVPTSRSPLPSPTPASTSRAPAPAVRPAYLAWPFTSGEQVRTWRDQGGPGKQPWHADAGRTALAFAAFLHADGLRVLTTTAEPGGVAVTLGRPMADGATHGVTVVHESRYDAAPRSPWIVTRAAAYHLRITDPARGVAVTSPLRVRAGLDGVDESIGFALWTADTARPIAGPAYGMGGAARGATAQLRFAPATSGVAMVVATEQSAAGDGLAQLAMVPVVVAKTTVGTAYPATYVGSVAGRIAVLSSSDGRVLRYLTDRQPGGGDSEPYLVGGVVYYAHGTGTCTGDVRRVPVAGGRSRPVVTGLVGAASSIAVSADGRMLAWVQGNCGGGGDLRIRDLRTGAEKTFAMGAPPSVEGRPAWAPDDRHLAFRYGHSAGGAVYPVVVLDVRADSRLDSARPASAPSECDEGSPAYAPDGSLVLVTCAGTRAVVARYVDGVRTATLLTLPRYGAGRVTQLVPWLDVAPDGHSLLLEVDRGSSRTTYRYTGSSLVAVGNRGSEPTW